MKTKCFGYVCILVEQESESIHPSEGTVYSRPCVNVTQNGKSADYRKTDFVQEAESGQTTRNTAKCTVISQNIL